MKLLKLNRLLLFLVFAAPILIGSLFQHQNQNVYIITLILEFILLFIWLAFLNQELMKRIPSQIEISDKLFMFNIFLLFISVSLFLIFAEPGVTYKVTGLVALLFFYYFYSMFQVVNHLSRILTIVEEEQEIEFGRRVGEMFLFLFYFVGIWWLQPRIINVLSKPEVVRKKYISVRKKEAMNSGSEEIK